LSSPDDWAVEYRELSEDSRYFVQMIWQATVAILALDALLIAAIPTTEVVSSELNRFFGLLPVLGSTLTVLIAVQVRKWQIRWHTRIERLKAYDRMKGFGRFYFEESGMLKFPLEPTFITVLALVAFGLLAYGFWLIVW
jgi:hypothetical protein